MKRYIAPIAAIYYLLATLLINSFMLVLLSPYALIGIIPLFLFINFLAGIKPRGTKRLRLRVCNHGALLLFIFLFSLIPSIAWHVALAYIIPTSDHMLIVWSAIYCAAASAIIFWNGIICVYCTSLQIGIKWRVIGLLCGLIPIVNIVILTHIIRLSANEVTFEIKKDAIENDPKLSEICKTKYPIIFVHGVFFRDNKLFNYWGRVPRTLKKHGATVYYGEHQSALSIKESARELAAKIKVIVERTECEKVNIIAHSKGGLDCRYAISKFGIAPYVASITTINTPHRGCFFAEELLHTVPEDMKNKIASTYNKAFTALGDADPDFLAAIGDLTADSCKKLNETLTFPEGIYAQSVGSVMGHRKKGKFPLNISYNFVKKYDGENDGLVGEASFAWGEKYTLLRTDGKRGISHGDVIDLNRENIRDFDVREFYTNLVSELRERGL